MLQKINGRPSRACKKMKDAAYPMPFPHELEYSSPCRGTWNIVHTGMLLPESHQIYICAAGCLRGVILTAAEMGCMDRFSSIELKDTDLYNTDNEMLIIDGVTNILQRLPKMPRAVHIFTACVHHFIGCNLRYVYKTLRKRFPAIAFIECFMDPIRQTESITPEERERRETVRLIQTQNVKEDEVNIIGNNFPTAKSSDVIHLLETAGYKVNDEASCPTFDDFLAYGKAKLNLYTNVFSLPAVKLLEKKHAQPYINLSQTWRYEEIEQVLHHISDTLGIERNNYRAERESAENALLRARKEIGMMPIGIDLSFTFRPFSLARLLLTHGFNVQKIYADAVTADDEADFVWVKENYGEIELWATKNPDLRVLNRGMEGEDTLLALGQKAAYFNTTRHFVNLVEGGGFWGFDAICRLAKNLRTAMHEKKDIRSLVSRKGWGGPSIL